jgi:hypothetical protein
MKKLILASYTLLILMIFTGCSIEKRIHNKGFHVEWSKSHKTLEVNSKDALNPKTQPHQNLEYIAINTSELHSNANLELISFAKKINIEKEEIKYQEVKNFEEENCDVIVLNNGTEIKAHVLEIKIREIIYRPCGQYSGKTIEIKRSEVKEILYPDGTKTEIEQRYSSKKKKEQKERIQKETNEDEISSIAKLSFRFGLWGLILTVIPFLTAIGSLFSITAIVLGAIGMKDGGRSRKRATAGLILGLIPLLILILALIILLIIFF